MTHLLLSIDASTARQVPDRAAFPAARLLAAELGPAFSTLSVGHSDADVDRALADFAGQRLIIDADLAGLHLALYRLMRAGRLGELETAVLPRAPISYLRRIGLPDDLPGRVAAAVHGTARLIGVVKDDSGGLCVDSAVAERWSAPESSWWVRAVVDDQRLCDGPVRALSMQRLGPNELVATARLSRFTRQRRVGRNLQFACDEAQIVADGVSRERARAKRTFWSEPKLWRLALPD
ncbi:MAG: hypothetical protein JWN95_3901 [Frankiales bacterium]|nr:hypothetical protein [Frankiales bacterium]